MAALLGSKPQLTFDSYIATDVTKLKWTAVTLLFLQCMTACCYNG